jgi:hypothetical protein
MNAPTPQSIYHQGIIDGIRKMMEFFAKYFYDDFSSEALLLLGKEVQAKFIMEGRNGLVSDEEFSYQLFAEIVARYGSPVLQPPPKFKQFEPKTEAPKKRKKRKPVKKSTKKRKTIGHIGH